MGRSPQELCKSTLGLLLKSCPDDIMYVAGHYVCRWTLYMTLDIIYVAGHYVCRRRFGSPFVFLWCNRFAISNVFLCILLTASHAIVRILNYSNCCARLTKVYVLLKHPSYVRSSAVSFVSDLRLPFLSCCL